MPSDASLFLAKSDTSSPTSSIAQTTKTYYHSQRFNNQELKFISKTKTSANSDIKDPSIETKLRERSLESVQDDAKYEHVGQDTRSQDGKDDQYKQG
ncbi:hypothetical protein Tco_0559616 [Tanacetum coccineum]